ncbi:MAG: nitrilase-related carbon-nitrogen hydrolase [Fimbriimonadaceae bacterium]
MFSLACAQIAPKKGDLAANLDTIAEVAIQASLGGVDLVIFPEGSTSGYFLEGGVLEAALTDSELLNSLAARLKGRLTRPLDVVLGFYQKAGGNLYNSAAYLELGEDSGRIVHIYRKFFLPTYGVFDEERFVARGKELGVFDTRLGRVAILICEDLWHSILPTLSALAGAQLLIVPSASPGRGFSGETVESLDRYHRLLTAVAEEHGIWCANCQLCGFEGGKGFVGGSSIVDPLGVAVAVSPVGEPHLLVSDVDFDLITIARSSSPLLADLENAWADIQRLVK